MIYVFEEYLIYIPTQWKLPRIKATKQAIPWKAGSSFKKYEMYPPTYIKLLKTYGLRQKKGRNDTPPRNLSGYGFITLNHWLVKVFCKCWT